MAMNMNMNNCAWCRGIPALRHQAHTHTLKICPALAEVTCSHCYEKGHTAKHCGLRKQERYEQRQLICPPAQMDQYGFISGGKIGRVRREAPRVQNSTAKTSSVFAAFQELSEVEETHFECEKCGFQHSCQEIVEEHEEKCNGLASCIMNNMQRPTAKSSTTHMALPKPKALPKLVWADCESDEEIGDWEFDEEEFPSLN